jgi:opacity protein-like surface antigen
MKRVLVTIGAGLVLVTHFAPGLSAQTWQVGLPGDDVASVVLNLGAVVPTTTLPDGSSHDPGMAVGVAATWWPLRNFGFKAQAIRSHTLGVHGDTVFSAAAAYSGEGSSVWLYSGELVLRLPIMADRVSPYLSGGPGGKSYRWSIPRPYIGRTTFAWAYAAGVDIRPTASRQFGLVIEGRYHRSQYKWHGLGDRGPPPEFLETGPTMNDFAVTAGVSVNW